MWTHTSTTRLTRLLALIACAVIISACKPRIVTGPEQTFTVDMPRTETGDAMNVTLELAVPQGMLTLAGGAEGLIQGAITYNAEEYKPQMTNDNGSLLISRPNRDRNRLLSACRIT